MTSLNCDSLPEAIIMVKDAYLIDCISDGVLHDPFQRRYEVRDQTKSFYQKKSIAGDSETSNKLLQVKGVRSKKDREETTKATPPRSQSREYSQMNLEDTSQVVAQSEEIGQSNLTKTPYLGTEDVAVEVSVCEL